MTKKEKHFAIQDGQTVVFIGDSITDCGRRLEAYPLGEGYVRFAVDLIAARYPERKINFINSGISGDVCTGLRERWQRRCGRPSPRPRGSSLSCPCSPAESRSVAA